MIKILLLSMFIGNASLLSAAYAAEDQPVVNAPVSAQEQTKGQIAAAEAMKKDAVCTKCHNEAKEVALYQTKHGVKGDARAPMCISCHGESIEHVKGTANPDPEKRGRIWTDVVFKKGAYSASDVKAQNATCMTCHDKDTKRNHWDTGAHSVGQVSCVGCHSVHSAKDKVMDRKTQAETCFACHKEQRAESRKISHHPAAEGKVTCTDCHNPHGSIGPKMLKKATLNETCFTCHAEKRGPFLWEHQPSTENCASCHTAHGSNITPLLKSRAPFSCQECHDGPHQSATPAGRNTGGRQGGLPSAGSVTGRSCLNCHSLVHGSNSPAGAYFVR